MSAREYAFDAVAEGHDSQFTRSRIGMAMRTAVWARCAARFRPGFRILESLASFRARPVERMASGSKRADSRRMSVVAAVTRRGAVESDELIALVASRLASYKRPSRVVFVPEIPRLPSGKVLRRVLKERLWTSV